MNLRTPNLRSLCLSAGLLLIALTSSLFVAQPAIAQSTSCSDFGGVLDGFAGDIAPSQIQIDQNCTIRNFPASNPLPTNFSFYTQPGQNNERWLIIFDNVVHTGNMSCNSVLEHRLWFVNGSSTSIQEGCQNLLIPVEKIEKDNPAGQSDATVGVPFTYTLTMPVLYAPGTQVVIDDQGSPNDLHGVTLTDDLNATGADLSYVSHVAYWESSGVPVPHTFSDAAGFLTFDNFPIVPAGEQIIIELTVVLDDTPANSNGTQFFNTAKWEFGRLIDDTFYQPLPGEWGVSDWMTIVAPDLTLTKSGPPLLDLGVQGSFVIDVQNVGGADAWDVTLVDQLPNVTGASGGGMCDVAPVITSAQVFAADGTTPVPGKGTLSAGTDFNSSWSGEPVCELTLTMLTAAASIGPGERLIVNYTAELDADSSNDVALTNIAAATEWFNGDASVVSRQQFTRTLTDGTPGTLDHEDAHTMSGALAGLYFRKTVTNLTAGGSASATPGDTLRYSLSIRTTDAPLTDVTIVDDLGDLNASQVFAPGTLTLDPATIPSGADTSNTDPNGGTNSSGLLDIRSFDLPADSEHIIEFEIELVPVIANGTLVTNQSLMTAAGGESELSDDPDVNGQASPTVDGDEDPTQIQITSSPQFEVDKISTDLDGDPAVLEADERLRYTITVANIGTEDAQGVLLRDLIPGNTTYVAGSTTFNGAAVADGAGGAPPIVAGILINSVADPTPGLMLADASAAAANRATVEFDVRVDPDAIYGTEITNQAFLDALSAGIADVPSDDPRTPIVDDPTRDVVGGLPLLFAEKSAALEGDSRTPGVVDPGDTLRYTIRIDNNGSAPVTSVRLSDAVPANTTYVADSLTLNGQPVGQPDGGTSPLIAGIGISSSDLTPPLPGPAGGTISPGESAVVEFVLMVNNGTPSGTLIVNQATVESSELEDLLTDGDGNPLTGPEPTIVVVGAVQQLAIAKQVAVVGGGQPMAGSMLEYLVTVRNVGSLAAQNVVITDDLDLPITGQLTFVAGSATMDGVANGITIAGSLLTADYSSAYGALPAGDSITLRFRALVDADLVANTLVINTAEVSWNNPPQSESASAFVTLTDFPAALDIDKVSSYIDGDPTRLLAGERLRYTITVVNTSATDVTDAVLRDDVPVNTFYVQGSTTLNGVSVPDTGSGGSPLGAGISISTPSDPTPGLLPSDPLGAPENTATIVFDVTVDPDVIDGTVVSNQAFVSALASDLSDLPSDDPRTPVADDPTRDVVGSNPLLFAEKSAAIEVDLGTPGVVDPGDTLRYTITVHNNGAVPATEVVVTDAVPTNTSYVADSTTLNGVAVAPDGGTSPLIAGLDVSSFDLTPPLPGAGEGTLSPSESAVIQFDVVVDTVPAGTLISNQATVASLELADLPTDGDGNPATGPEPTIVVVGDVQQLSITKEVAVVGGGPALAGSTLEYTVRVQNLAAVPAYYVEIVDNLDLPDAGQLAYVANSATLDGLAVGVAAAGPVVSADYGAAYGVLQPGAATVLRFQAVLDSNLTTGAVVTNIAEVSWNDPSQTASASVSVNIGGTPGTSAIDGSVWHDANFDDLLDSAERLLGGWLVELYQQDQLIHTTQTDADGTYRISALPPTAGNGDEYAIRFRAPGAGPNTASLGLASSLFNDGQQTINGITVDPDNDQSGLNLPIDPNGVVYNSVSRGPLAGAVLTVINVSTGQPVPSTCFDDQAQQGQVTLADGYYKFDMIFADAACPPNGAYLIDAAVPSGAFIPGVSQLIPPTSSALTAPLSLPNCLQGGAADAILATTDFCEATASEFAPLPSAPSGSPGTAYYLQLTLTDTNDPGSAQIFNNHIPLDPDLTDAVSVTKTSPTLSVTRGQLVPYVITVTNDIGFDLTEVSVIDRFPVGFRYVAGSARIDTVPAEPDVVGQELIWSDLAFLGAGQHRIDLLLAVGAGVSEGDFVNRALARHNVFGNQISNEATATVRLVPDPDFDCTDVMGKVYDDANRNGRQDPGEAGLPGIRLVSTTGLAATTDSYGRYHITCATVPNESRGSNFVLKLDDRTLPAGFRASLQPIQIERATRGKALRMNFGASIHRVVGLDLADPIFEPGTTGLRSQWESRIVLLLDQLVASPSVLRLTYLADIEDPRLVEDRLAFMEDEISMRWEAQQAPYELEIETQIFWRLGGPPDLSAIDTVGEP
ncbi:MAG: hypothetical protein PVH89_00675 [Gammaproteobacteria bacterium]|jgi:uncharacterized repeat protein (TIGR01451 family)